MTPQIETKALAVREERPLSVVPSDAQIHNIQQLGSVLAKSGYFMDARDQAQAAVKVMAGAELGIPPIASMMGIHIIKGKVALGAHLIGSRIRAHGYEFEVKVLDNNGCTLVFYGKPDETGKRKKLGESGFSREDAQAAGVLSNETYKKFPRNMFWARAVSNGAKWYTPDVLSGMPVYVPEELGAPVDDQGDLIVTGPTPEQIAAERIAQEKAKLEAQRNNTSDGNAIEPEVLEIWNRMGSKADTMLEAFKELKKGLVQACGAHAGEGEYYRVLKAHNVEKSNDYVRGPKASASNARACVRALWQALQDARSLGMDAEDVPEVSDAD